MYNALVVEHVVLLLLSVKYRRRKKFEALCPGAFGRAYQTPLQRHLSNGGGVILILVGLIGCKFGLGATTSRFTWDTRGVCPPKSNSSCVGLSVCSMGSLVKDAGRRGELVPDPFNRRIACTF